MCIKSYQSEGKADASNAGVMCLYRLSNGEILFVAVVRRVNCGREACVNRNCKRIGYTPAT